MKLEMIICKHALLFAFILLCLVSNIVAGSRNFKTKMQYQNNNVNFNIYPRRLNTKPYLLKAGDILSAFKSVYDPSIPLKVVIHGFQSSCNNDVFLKINNAFLKTNEEINVVCVDWSILARNTYYEAIDNTWAAGLALSELLDWLVFVSGADLEEVHLIGHSLGAHVAGIAASNVQLGTIGRITGLDPAVPAITMTPEKTLDITDAIFVELIFTSMLSYGHPLCHVNYFINGGITQPSCNTPKKTDKSRNSRQVFEGEIICSHSKAYELLSQAIENPFAFPVIMCPDVESAMIDERGVCQHNKEDKLYMFNLDFIDYGIYSVNF